MEEIAKDFLKNNPNYGDSIIGKLGEGNFGEVYETDKGFVIKVTGDKEEAKTVSDIAKKANGKFTPFYHTLKNIGGKYVIVMDKVDPIKLTSQQNSLLNMFRDKILMLIKSDQDISQFKEAISLNIPDKKMVFVLNGVIDAIKGLKDIGIVNADIHEDNLGLSNGKLVMLDIIDEKLVKESFRSLIREFIEKILK